MHKISTNNEQSTNSGPLIQIWTYAYK